MNIKQKLAMIIFFVMLSVGLSSLYGVQSVSAAAYGSKTACEAAKGTWSGSANPTRDDVGGVCTVKNVSKAGCESGGGTYTAKSKQCDYTTEAVTSGGGSTSANTCAGVETSIISCGGKENAEDLKDNGIWLLLLQVLQILSIGVGIAAVGGIVFASVLYASAQDNDAQVKKAKDMIANVVIGVVAYILMYSFLQFIIPGGVFS